MQGFDLIGSECRRRLVEKQDPGLGDQRLRHLEQLPLGQGEEAGRSVGKQFDIQIELGENLPRPLLSAPVARPGLGGRGVVEVVLDRLGKDRRAILIRDGEPETLGQGRRVAAQQLASDLHRAQIWLHES